MPDDRKYFVGPFGRRQRQRRRYENEIEIEEGGDGDYDDDDDEFEGGEQHLKWTVPDGIMYEPQRKVSSHRQLRWNGRWLCHHKNVYIY